MMELKEVYPICFQAAQAGFGGGNDPFTGKAAGHFGGQHHLITYSPPVQPVANDFFGGPSGVGFGRIEEIDAAFQSVIHKGDGRYLINLSPERHTAQPNRTYFQFCRAQLPIFHYTLSSVWR
jgi:hypothetical protein